MGSDSNQNGRSLRHVQTAAVRYDPDRNQYRLSPTAAIRAAGLEADATIRYGLDRLEALGVVPVVAADDEPADDPEPRTNSGALDLSYAVQSPESGEDFRLEIPEAVLDALHIDAGGDAEDTDAERTSADAARPLLDVYAGEGVIAVGGPTTETVPAELLPDDVAVEGEALTLQLVQTTTPRYQGTTLAAAITPAFNRAGGDFAAVEFRPVTDHEGFVLAVARADATGPNTRSVYRQGPDKQGAAVSLPEEVLAALDLERADFEGVPHDERPALAVYAGDDVLAFGHPPHREFPAA